MNLDPRRLGTSQMTIFRGQYLLTSKGLSRDDATAGGLTRG